MASDPLTSITLLSAGWSPLLSLEAAEGEVVTAEVLVRPCPSGLVIATGGTSLTGTSTSVAPSTLTISSSASASAGCEDKPI